MSLLKTIANKTKVLSLTLIVAVLSQIIMPVGLAKASNPIFNDMEHDWELLQGTNKSRGDSEWSDPVTGQAGDTFAGIIYYHNTILGSVAENTTIKLNIPSSTVNGQAVLSASIQADNAARVTDTIYNGNVIGKSGLTVKLNEDANISLVPGTVKWFPNYRQVGTPEQQLPGGQTGDEIISASGINIGNINGCWEFVGYVTFRFKTDKLTFPSLGINKVVRNVSINETSYFEENLAAAGDVLEYRVDFKNNGTRVAENVVLIDVIPANTSYLTGTTVLNLGNGEQTIGDGIIKDGISLGNLAPGQTGYARFKVGISRTIAVNEILVNTAYLIHGKDQLSDTAKTRIVTTPTPGKPPVGPGLPVTGGNSLIFGLILLIAAGLVSFYVYKKRQLKNVFKVQ